MTEHGQTVSGSSPNELRSLIAEISASNGTLPPERELVQQLGVPRSRLRRVLAGMREAGHLPPAQVGRRTTRKTGPQTENLARVANPMDVIELRLILEPQLARLAAVRASAVEIARITRAATSMPEEDYGTPDLTFHLEIANASRNALARELYRILRRVGADARVRLPDRRPACEKRRSERDTEHMRIARAIAERDTNRAEASMRLHLSNVRALVMEWVAPEPVQASAAATDDGVV